MDDWWGPQPGHLRSGEGHGGWRAVTGEGYRPSQVDEADYVARRAEARGQQEREREAAEQAAREALKARKVARGPAAAAEDQPHLYIVPTAEPEPEPIEPVDMPAAMPSILARLRADVARRRALYRPKEGADPRR